MNGMRVTRMERLLLAGLGLLLAGWLLAGARPPLLHGAPPAATGAVATR